MKKSLILDGNSLVFRAFYALPILTSEEGVCTNAVYGFANMLFKMKDDIKPDYIFVAFDRKAPTFRHLEYKDYKAGRQKTPVELREQFPLVKEMLSLMNIKILEIDGFEADDIIGTIAEKCDKEGIEAYIYTADRDALQLASERTNVVLTKKGVSEVEIFDKERMMEEYGITPLQFIDVKGLMGDKSDNLPGIPGVGEKTALKLISQYGSIEEVINHIDEIKGNKLRENLSAFKEQALKSKHLATIITEVPIEYDIEEGAINDENSSELRKFFIKYNMKSILNKLPKNDDGEAVGDNSTVIEVSNINSLKDCFENVGEISYISYILKDRERYSTKTIDTFYLNSDDKIFKIDYDNLYNDEECLSQFKSYFEDENKKKVVVDTKDLYTVLSKSNISIKGIIFDITIAAYLLDSSKNEYDIDKLAFKYLGEEIDKTSSNYLINMNKQIKPLYDLMKEKIKDQNMEHLLYDVEMPLCKVLSSMESIGFNVNENKLDELEVKFKGELNKTQEEIFKLSEEEFNINSPKQLGKILFEKLDLPVIKKTKTGYSTNSEVLEKLQDKHPIIEKIIYFRQLSKIYSTYVEGLKAVIDKDGRIHSSFNQTVTTTGRLSSTEPNLQNIPIKYEMGREIRKVFIPLHEDDIILSADYSQIELRVLAHIAGDENMIDAFKHGVDIHTKTASEVFNVPIDEVTSLMRSSAKAVNFGIVYGISDFSLSQDLKITRKEAKKYMDIYFDRYPKINQYLHDVVEHAADKKYVLTILNRKRFIPEIGATNKIVKAFGERLAMNAPIQGSAADIIKLAMVKVYNSLKEHNLKSSIILQVHDELILNVKKDELDMVRKIVKEGMENVIKLSVALNVDINEGNTWYEAK